MKKFMLNLAANQVQSEVGGGKERKKFFFIGNDT